MDVFIGEQNSMYEGSTRLCCRATLAEAVSEVLEAARRDRTSDTWTVSRVSLEGDNEVLVWKAVWFKPWDESEACIQYGPVGEGGWIDLARAVREYPGGSAASKTREASHVR